MDDEIGGPPLGGAGDGVRGEGGSVGPLHHQAQPDGPPPRSGEELRVSPNKNRLVQVRRTGRRKLFDKAAKELFLEWFAATCNVRLSAARAGVAYQTVFKHRMKDPEFADAWDVALAQGYARLEARLLQEVHRPGDPSTIESSFDGLPPRSGEELEVRSGLHEAEAEEAFDAQLALAILREQKRNVHGHVPKAQRTTARAASNKEIAEALAKRLKGFALRVAAPPALPPAERDANPRPGPLPHAPHGPPPRPGEDQ